MELNNCPAEEVVFSVFVRAMPTRTPSPSVMLLPEAKEPFCENRMPYVVLLSTMEGREKLNVNVVLLVAGMLNTSDILMTAMLLPDMEQR
ncbi:hypothetical protein AC781_07650 [Akkermansia glycaniphila]|nr:hypothetical protein AC781_07650 [Akkermansia glycaniphila]